MSRKPAQTYFKYDKCCIENTQKYIYHGRRAALHISHSSCGVNGIGSKNLQQFFLKYKEEINQAACLDTLGLIDPRPEVLDEHCPELKSDSAGGIMRSFYSKSETPLLPWPVEIMNTQLCLDWALPELRKDICEVSGVPITKIQWGSTKHTPRQWPVNWSLMTNPTHAQHNIKEIGEHWTNTTILQEYIKLRINSKGLDYNNHIGKFLSI